MAEHDVVIAGAGPAGMMLAAELALGEVDVVLVERRPDHNLVGSRAGGFHARTIEVLDQRGVADRFLAAGITAQASMLGGTVLDMSDFPTRHPYALGLFQNKIERIMADWIAELPVRILYAREVAGFVQDDAGVDVELTGGEVLRARYLVGCDGGRSAIRKAAGIGFPGEPATRSTLIAEVELSEDPPTETRFDDAGAHGLHRLEDGHTFRVITSEIELAIGEPDMSDLSAALTRAYGRDFGIHTPTWISRFTDATRQADAYRAGRVLLAGDSAHIHYPAGGQGISLGVQDAVNLGWKLAQLVHGTASEALLDTYESERQPVAARALEHTMAQSVLQLRDPRTAALARTVGQIAALDEPRKLICGLISGLDIHYDLGQGHPLLGRRMPDLDIELAGDGHRRRVFELLHQARPLLLNLGVAGRFASDGRVPVVDAAHDGRWELPVLGEVAAPDAVLVRPDGYVAWVGENGGQAGLVEALTRWFGPPRS